MAMSANPILASDDSPQARRYNSVKRWLSVADFAIGVAFMAVLLATGWSGWLRDVAYKLGFQNYTLSIFFYLLLLLLIGKVLGAGLDYYGFRIERKFQLSNQQFRSWIWDEVKGFLVGLVLGSIVVELLYLTIRQWPSCSRNWLRYCCSLSFTSSSRWRTKTFGGGWWF
jgi:hypothetical protein